MEKIVVATNKKAYHEYNILEQWGQFLCEFGLAINSLTNWGNNTILQPLQLFSWIAQTGVAIPFSWQRS